MVVIADDLTGAADCVASRAALGCRTVVLLYSRGDEQFGTWPNAEILSIDANSRCLPAERASQLTKRLVHLCDSQNEGRPGYVLFKKIDSTLRGNVAGELAALLEARRSANAPNTKLCIVMSPALPAQGRTTAAGRLLVEGVPLEETDIWQAEAGRAPSDIRQLLAKGGLSCGLIERETVRSTSAHLRQAMQDSAKANDVVLCDAETDGDLRAIAEASAGEPAFTALAGSAGLASQIPHAIGIAPKREPHFCRFASGPTLFVVGTAASISREQARILGATPELASFHATHAALHHSHAMHSEIMRNIRSGRDVLLLLDGGEHCQEPNEKALLPALADLGATLTQFLGGLVATGGETARAVLDALGIKWLRVLGEVEAGLPFSVADGWVRPVPVITKAGAFGSPQALVHCREYLLKLERSPFNARDLLLNYES